MLWVTTSTLTGLAALLVYLSLGVMPGKMLTVAQAAFRETIRQPLYWVLIVFFALLMILSVFLPYFTFGEDLKMMKELQLDAILAPIIIVAIFTSALSVAEEIEGRTAVTLLSKPISRRHFLLGKFTGIFLACVLMTLVLSLVLGLTVHMRTEWEMALEADREKLADPAEVQALQNTLSFLPPDVVAAVRAVLMVFAEIQALLPGIVFELCQAMIMTAVATALATRLTVVVNIVICLVWFFASRLGPILVAQAQENPLVKFVAQVFGVLLPGLNYYDVGMVLASGREVPVLEYVLPGISHAVIYTVMALLIGLILFEDRDLA